MSGVPKPPLTTESRFWDIFFQAVLFARPLATFWRRVADLGSARLFALSRGGGALR
jgi:hypothetical protein